MVEISVALITAVATIVAALLQYSATTKALGAGRTGAEAGPRPRSTKRRRAAPAENTLSSPTLSLFNLGLPNHVYWYFFGSLVMVLVIVFGTVNPDYSVLVNTFGIIPVASIALAVRFPIRPAYSPLFVTLATASGYLGYAMSGSFYQAFVVDDLPFVFVVYVLNVLLVAGVDYLSYQRSLRDTLPKGP